MTPMYFGGLSGVSLRGNQTDPNADKLTVRGAYFLALEDLSVFGFGRDNISITSSPSAPTSFVHASRIVGRRAGRAALYVARGGSYTTAVYVDHFSLMTTEHYGLRAAIVDGAQLVLSNGYIDTNHGKGIALSNGATITAHAVIAEGGRSTNDVMIDIASAPTAVSKFLRGDILIVGRVKWADGTLSSVIGWTTHYSTYARMFAPFLDGYMALGNADAPQPVEGVEDYPPQVRLGRQGTSGSGTEAVVVTGASFRPEFSYKRPLQTGVSGAMWRNAADGHLRYEAGARQPKSDDAGVPLSTFVHVPRSATALCSAGEWSADSQFLYVCVSGGQWRRNTLAAW